MKKTKVLIIDDSITIRKMLRMLIDSDSQFEVVGEAEDPYDAREKIKELNPDVITLDVEMPKMDGITFLKNLMRLRPMPVLMISTRTEKNADITLQALDLGAVDYVTKPSARHQVEMKEYAKEILEKLRIVASANIKAIKSIEDLKQEEPELPCCPNAENKLIAIGASTGGTEAIRTVLSSLNENSPPIIITQHIGQSFCESFAQRLNKLTPFNVAVAEANIAMQRGCVYLAPGDKHLTVRKSGTRYVTLLDDGPEFNYHKPSVEVMFNSLLNCDPSNVVATILTGMGEDGAAALKKLREAGAGTLTQDKDSCVIWGMPRRAMELDPEHHVAPLHKIASKIIALLNQK